MEKEKTILMGIDDSEACEKSISYVANILCSNQKYGLILFHVIPPLPPHLLEFGGSEDPDDESDLDEKLKREQAEWIEKEKVAARKFLDKASRILGRAGISPNTVTTMISEQSQQPDVVKVLLDTAGKNNCGTIVVGRKFYPAYRLKFNLDIGEELVRRGSGFTIWVVE